MTANERALLLAVARYLLAPSLEQAAQLEPTIREAIAAVEDEA